MLVEFSLLLVVVVVTWAVTVAVAEVEVVQVVVSRGDSLDDNNYSNNNRLEQSFENSELG